MPYSQEQTRKAAEALLKFVDAQELSDKKQSLLDDDEDTQAIYLNISGKKYLSDKKQLKPKRVVLPHPLRSRNDTSICMFTKDPQRSYKNVVQGDDELVERVVGVSKLKGKFKPYQARRSLLSAHDLFVAEDSVVTTLPKLLGKVFYDGPVGRIPLAIKAVNKDGKIDGELIGKELEKLVKSTVFVLPPGAMVSIKVGKTSFSADQIAENVDAVMQYFADHIKPWDQIRSVYIKTNQSESLPVYMAPKLYSGDDIETDQKDASKKRDRSQLTDFEQELTQHFDEEDLEKFTNKKIKS